MLAGCDPKTVRRYVALRDGGQDPFVPSRRARGIDPYLEKVEELVDRSRAKVRADKVHEHKSERLRRAAAARKAYLQGKSSKPSGTRVAFIKDVGSWMRNPPAVPW